MNTHSQWSKQEVCFADANQVWLTVNHSNSFTSGELIRCSQRIAQASELGSCQSYLCQSRGYEWLQKSKDSLKAYFENVNIPCKHDTSRNCIKLGKLIRDDNVHDYF